jgi:hypothetical protein
LHRARCSVFVSSQLPTNAEKNVTGKVVQARTKNREKSRRLSLASAAGLVNITPGARTFSLLSRILI